MATTIELTGNFAGRELKTPGNVTQGLIEAMAKEITPDIIIAKIKELLEAEHITAGGKWIPDHRAREAGLKLALSYILGLPVQRQEIVTKEVTSQEQLIDMAKSSPAMQDALREFLAKISPVKALEVETSK